MLEEVRIRRPTVDGTATAPRMQTCDHSRCELLGRSHMCEYGACRGAGQLLGASNPRVESLCYAEKLTLRQRHFRRKKLTLADSGEAGGA